MVVKLLYFISDTIKILLHLQLFKAGVVNLSYERENDVYMAPHLYQSNNFSGLYLSNSSIMGTFSYKGLI